jgi:hypothetical protein
VLYNNTISSAVYFSGDIERTETLELDISKGNIDIINEVCIFQNKVYRSKSFIITGSSELNQIFVHNNYLQKQNLIFKAVKVNYQNSGKQDFMILDNDVSLNLQLSGNNSLVLGNQSRGFYVGHDASINFTCTNKDSLQVITGEGSSAIYTNYGNVNQYGGNLNFDLGDNSSAINVGNYGTFSLYSGKFEAHSNKGSSITGLSSMRVNVHGGTLVADIIGIMENGNEEVLNRSYFTLTGGDVKLKRIIFVDYTIYNGSLDVYILGSGTGCDVTMYGGTLEIGAYIDYKYEILETDVMNEKILGGTVNQRNDVPMEVLHQIKTDLG